MADVKKPFRLTIAVTESMDGGYLAIVRELPGCIAQGETPEEAEENIIDVTQAFLEAILEEQGADGKVVLVGKVLEEREYEVKPLELVPA